VTAPRFTTTPRREQPSASQRAFAERTQRTLGRRKVLDRIMVGLTYAAAVLAVLPLVAILVYLLSKGAAAVTPAFFTEMPRPVGEPGGGMANAIVGTLILVSTASAIGLPIGIGAGLYLAEKRSTTLANVVRFLSDVLNGLPSIVMGIVAWQLIVRPMGDFSALAGGFALGAMMIPLVTRTTEEMVRVVPVSLREAALALGYTRWRTSLTIVLRTAMAGIVTGVLVAVARIAGETAPLLFTALGSNYWPTAVDQPIASLPQQIYVYATGPYDTWRQQAFAGALVLLGLILVISLIARWVTRGRFVGGGD
jgi:phosphate transport system permease protein